MERVCLNCGTPLFGRSDKKFCSHNCRSYYNNIIYKKRHNTAEKNSYIKLIINSLSLMQDRKRYRLIKIIFFLTTIFKIISNFETSKTPNRLTK